MAGRDGNERSHPQRAHDERRSWLSSAGPVSNVGVVSSPEQHFHQDRSAAAASPADDLVLANTTSLVQSVATPAFVLARVCPVDGAVSLLLSREQQSSKRLST